MSDKYKIYLFLMLLTNVCKIELIIVMTNKLFAING